MAEPKPWARTDGSATFTDAEVDAVEAERVLTMVEIAALPNVIDQIEALDRGKVESTIKPLTVEELRTVQAIGRWYAGACATAGAPAPPDIFRAAMACAWQVVSYNVALSQAGVDDAVDMPAEHRGGRMTPFTAPRALPIGRSIGGASRRHLRA